MRELLQRRLLERELELMTFFALGIAADLAATRQRQDALTLTRTLFAASLKLSRLLWPFGRRAGDELAAQEAAELRAEIGIDGSYLLSPEQTAPLATALRLSATQLDGAFDPEHGVLTLDGQPYRLAVLVDAIRLVHQAVTPGREA